MHGYAWPKHVTDRPYLAGGLCGNGTNHACPRLNTPITRRGGLHGAHDGTLRPVLPGERRCRRARRSIYRWAASGASSGRRSARSFAVMPKGPTGVGTSRPSRRAGR